MIRQSIATSANNYSSDDEEKTLPIGIATTFHERLLDQLHLRSMTEHEYLICEHLIGSLDDSGYLRRELIAAGG